MDTSSHKIWKEQLTLLVVGAMMVVLFFPALTWIINSVKAPEYRLHFALLTLFFFGLLRKFQFQWINIRCQFSLFPLIVFLLGLACYHASSRVYDIDVLACTSAGLAIYGFAGFFMPLRTWRDASIVVLLFFVCLPLSYHIEIFLGFPLRLLSAKVVGHIFDLFGAAAHSAETILLIENKFTHIDLPCSGSKSLWSVTLFFLLFSMIERLKVGATWCVLFAGAWLLAAAANIVRIILLILLFHSSLPALFKDAVHIPIGMIGFISVCAIIYGLLKTFGQKSVEEQSHGCFQVRFLSLVGLVLIVAIAIQEATDSSSKDYVQRSVSRESQNSLPLTESEQDLFLRHGVIRYDKRNFLRGELRGSAILVLARSWRAHHHPEQCLQASGAGVSATRTLMVNGTLPVRLVEVKDSDKAVVYWFQSLTETTDDYASRVWAGLIRPRMSYVMVTLYLEKSDQVEDSQLVMLVDEFQSQARQILEKENEDEI